MSLLLVFLHFLLIHEIHHEGVKFAAVIIFRDFIRFFVVIELIFECVDVELFDKLTVAILKFVHEVKRAHELIILDMLDQLFKVDLLQIFLVLHRNFIYSFHQCLVLVVSIETKHVHSFLSRRNFFCIAASEFLQSLLHFVVTHAWRLLSEFRTDLLARVSDSFELVSLLLEDCLRILD